MAVSSVQNSSEATTQALQQSRKTTTQETQQSQNGGQARRAGNATGTTHSNATQATHQQAQAQTTQAPKPVVNTQGQKTGQVLNTTA